MSDSRFPGFYKLAPFARHQALAERFGLTEAARIHIWRALTRFSSAQVCNVRV